MVAFRVAFVNRRLGSVADDRRGFLSVSFTTRDVALERTSRRRDMKDLGPFQTETAPGRTLRPLRRAGPRVVLGIVSPFPPENLARAEFRRHNRLDDHACQHGGGPTREAVYETRRVLGG